MRRKLMVTACDQAHLAEGGGFEPPEACTSHAFEACALVRSATLPPASVTEPEVGSRTPGRRRPAVTRLRTRVSQPTRLAGVDGGCSTDRGDDNQGDHVARRLGMTRLAAAGMVLLLSLI